MIVRRGVFYMMLGCLIVVSFVEIAIGIGLLDTRSDANGTQHSLAIGCGRANRTRDALHWLAQNVPGIPPEIADGLTLRPEEHPQTNRPWLVDCDAAYR